MVKFGTLEYYQAYADAMNKDEAWMKSALTTSFMYIFTDVFNADGTPKAFLLKIDNGKTTASEAKAAELNQVSKFGCTGNYALLSGIAKGEINQQKAKLKLDMMYAMKNQNNLKRMATIQKEMKGVEY